MIYVVLQDNSSGSSSQGRRPKSPRGYWSDSLRGEGECESESGDEGEGEWEGEGECEGEGPLGGFMVEKGDIYGLRSKAWCVVLCVGSSLKGNVSSDVPIVMDRGLNYQTDQVSVCIHALTQWTCKTHMPRIVSLECHDTQQQC
ncbi:hypothetical protein E2C01_056672 [Portunus trituberculatus]|uniref:Uncharacterized protein n=1 Tax=Portunus trituberculatus TaxID=210409 RepID=A0A5B7GYD2_PORTR|nr:hypothetical protein [Portunus trituberculatus]